MRKVMHKLMALAAIVGVGLPVAQAHAQEQASVLPVVSLVPENQAPIIGRKALVAIRLVDSQNVVHKVLYFTSYNTVDITLEQVAEYLKGRYEVEMAPQNVQVDTNLKNYVTNQYEFNGSHLQADFVLKNPATVPVEDVTEPVVYPAIDLEGKVSDLFYEQLVTVDVKDEAGQALATSHYLINSDSTDSPVATAANAFVKAHPNYVVDAQTAQQVGTVDRTKLEEVSTSLGVVNVFRSHYTLTAMLANAPRVNATEATEPVASQSASQQSEVSSQESVSAAQPASQVTENLSSLPQVANQSSQPVTTAQNEQATKPAPQSSQAASNSQDKASAPQQTPSGRRLPDTGEVATVTFLALGLALTAAGIVLVKSYQERMK